MKYVVIDSFSDDSKTKLRNIYSSLLLSSSELTNVNRNVD